MNNSTCKKILPLYAPKLDEQIIDFPIEQSKQILISEKEYRTIKCELRFWKAMHYKSIIREGTLKQTIKKLEGDIRDLRHRVFGKKSEKKSSSKDCNRSKKSDSKRCRGQQLGSKGHGRTKRPDLPKKIEEAKLFETPKCPGCGIPNISDGSKDAEIIEVEVKAYTRKIKRQRMRKDCKCSGIPNTITAPIPPKALPKSDYGNSIWEAVLLTKFHHCQPTNRLLNQYKRCKAFDRQLSIAKQSPSFSDLHEKLVEKMDTMAKERDIFVEAHKPDDPNTNLLSIVKFKILTSLQNHWDGLNVFVEHPEVPMDNNPAERSIRNPVTGKKNFYGSGSLWSSQLAAIMFSLFQTMVLCGLNSNHWLRSYLTACAENYGKTPEDLSPFLPWEMDENRRHKLSNPPDTS